MNKGKINYVVNPEKRTVVCYLMGCYYDIEDKLPSYQVALADRFGLDINLQPKYIGIAKCAPEDEFDENIGKSIALDRMLVKYHKDCAKIYRQLSELMLDILGNVIDKMEYHQQKVYDRTLEKIGGHYV